MSKKDYILLAEALKDSKPVINFSERLNENQAVLVQWNRTVENIAYALAKDNDRFNRNKFLTAAGYNE
jgi:hypothetical protein